MCKVCREGPEDTIPSTDTSVWSEVQSQHPDCPKASGRPWALMQYLNTEVTVALMVLSTASTGVQVPADGGPQNSCIWRVGVRDDARIMSIPSSRDWQLFCFWAKELRHPRIHLIV